MTQALDAAQAKLKGYLDELKPLQKAHTDGTLTDEQRARAKELGNLMKTVGQEIDNLRETDNAFAQLGSMADYLGKAPGAKTAPLLGGADDQEQRSNIYKGSLREFMDSPGYKDVAATGHGKSGRFKLGPNFQRMSGLNLTGHETPDQLRTLIYEGATANLVQDQRLPGIIRPDSQELRVREALMSARTNSTSVSFVRELVVTNNAAGFTEATTAGASPGPSDADFPESAITFEVDSESVKSIGHMIPVTREMLDDVALMESYIQSRMIEMLNDKIDAQLMSGAGGNDLTGLYNVTGITALDAAYFSSAGLSSTGQPGEDVDRIRHARSYHRVVNKARGTHALIHPYDMEAFEFLRDDNGQYLYPAGSLPTRMGVTPVETENATRGLPIVVDKRHSAVIDKMENSVEVTDSNRDWWEFRILGMAVWSRLMLVPFRPAAIATVQLTTYSA